MKKQRRQPPERRMLVTAAMLAAAGTLTACGSDVVDVTWCNAEIETVALYNAYGDRPEADLQELSGAEAQDWCQVSFPYDTIPAGTWPDPKHLGTSFHTVAVLTYSGGRETTIWIDRIPGESPQTAIETSDGARVLLSNAGPGRYWGSEAQQVPSSDLPQRPE